MKPSDCWALFVLLTLFVLPWAEAGKNNDAFNSFDPDFKEFIWKYYYPYFDRFVREDLDNTGSFGGGYAPESNVRPVILVHGLRNQAGSLWLVRQEFMKNGIPEKKIYATTWGRGESTNWQLDETLSCAHVQHIRNFIKAVAEYTHSQVDVIAYSMGAPIARKAIMGGNCVENNEELGDSLTSLVHTFVSVAGPNHGSYLCGMMFGNVCNFINGLSCFSKYLMDINSRTEYEGAYRYSIASENDQVVGYWACGRKTSFFDGAEAITVHGLNHDQTEFETWEEQLRLIRKDP